MARRVRFASSWRRALRTMTRTARAGVKAIVKARKTIAAPSPRRSKTASHWLDGVAISAAGGRRYKLFKPVGTRADAGLPLFVLLHGCGQDAAAIARVTRVHTLAARENFIVLCPEQERYANAQGCWNWFDQRSGRAAAEAASILAAVDQACTTHGADATRVVIAGLSAGSSMAALLASRHPERFAAVAMHSGVPPGAAQSAASAVRAMQGRGNSRALPLDTARPAMLVIQGDADNVVAAANGGASTRWWTDTLAAKTGPTRIVQRGKRRAARVTDYRVGTRVAATLCVIKGLRHAWSGGVAGQLYSDATGPDATRMIWQFAVRAFKARA